MFHVKLTDLTFYADSTMDPPKVKLALLGPLPLCRRMDMRTTIRSLLALLPAGPLWPIRKPFDQSAAATVHMCVYNLVSSSDDQS
jgi:hypothetical protein